MTCIFLNLLSRKDVIVNIWNLSENMQKRVLLFFFFSPDMESFCKIINVWGSLGRCSEAQEMYFIKGSLADYHL